LEETAAERQRNLDRQREYERQRMAAEQKRQAEELARQEAIQARKRALVAVLIAQGFEIGEVKDLGNGKVYMEGVKS
jgi:hypothetical protein